RANQDELTGLFSRHYFERQVALRAREVTSPGQLLLIDLDNFKQINDRHGHPAGDAMLRACVQELHHNEPQPLPPCALLS
ncbi:MAG: GGDEF domain-containing protein, partial [Aeromonas veronii]